MRCLSCQCQSFQSESDTPLQKPRPAERNSLRGLMDCAAGGASPFSIEVSLCIQLAHYNFVREPVKLRRMPRLTESFRFTNGPVIASTGACSMTLPSGNP